MSWQLRHHVDALGECIEQLRTHHTGRPCPHCHGFGRVKRVDQAPRLGHLSWRRLLVLVRFRVDRIVHDHCGDCGGSGFMRAEPDMELALKMGFHHRAIAAEVERLTQADAALRAAGVRIEQAGTKAHYREGNARDGEVPRALEDWV